MFTRFLPTRWPNELDLLLYCTLAVVLFWLGLTIFIYWRRSVTNLTPVDVPNADPDAQPDFLTVDREKRAAALARGDAYVERLMGTGETPVQRASWIRRLLGYSAILLVVVTLVTVLAGSVWPESFAGEWLRNCVCLNK